MKLTAPQFKQVIDSTSATDPCPERRINAETMLEARLSAFDAKRSTRPVSALWRWLQALLPLLLLAAAASANTIVVDLAGNIIGTFPWPSDRNVVVVVPTVSGGGTSIFARTPAPGTPTPTAR